MAYKTANHVNVRALWCRSRAARQSGATWTVPGLPRPIQSCLQLKQRAAFCGTYWTALACPGSANHRSQGTTPCHTS